MYLIYSCPFLSDFSVDLFIPWMISQMLTGCHSWAPENFGGNFLEQDKAGNLFPLSEKKEKCHHLWGAAMEKRQQVTCIITHSLWEMAVCHQWYWWGDRGDLHLGSEITFICTSIGQSAKPRMCYCTERSPFVLLRSTCSSTIKQSRQKQQTGATFHREHSHQYQYHLVKSHNHWGYIVAETLTVH